MEFIANIYVKDLPQPMYGLNAVDFRRAYKLPDNNAVRFPSSYISQITLTEEQARLRASLFQDTSQTNVSVPFKSLLPGELKERREGSWDTDFDVKDQERLFQLYLIGEPDQADESENTDC